MTDVTTGFGAELHIDTGSGLTKVAEVDSIPEVPGSSERELYETTSHDNTDFKSFKKHPLREATEITITGNYVINSASDALLQAAEDADGPLPYRVVLPQEDTSYNCDGNGLFYGLKRMNDSNGKRTFEITLKPIDAPTTVEVV